MREYLFRGKRKDSGEWVEGYLYITHNGVYEIGCYNTQMNIERWTFEVDPATVGQFTGLMDKNGKRIFEGDIVDGADFGLEDDGYGVVSWNDGAFEVGNNFINGTFHENFWGQELEIIGNIHDNPELLNK